MKQIWFSSVQEQKLQILEERKKNRSDISSKEMSIRGVGFKAWSKDKFVHLDVGYTHYVSVRLPEDLRSLVRKTRLLFSSDKKNLERVGTFSRQIRNIRAPDPYKGKGIRYKDENLKCKVGKVKT